MPVWTALGLLDELDGFRPEALASIISYLDSIEVAGGGVPFVLPSANRSPHAPWWETHAKNPHTDLNPTAGIAGLLFKRRVAAPWLDRAAAWCWGQIDRLGEVTPYQLRVVLSFLDRAPDRDRAEQTLERLRPLILKRDVVELNVRKTGDVFRPLDFAPHPGLLSRSLFADDTIERQLDALERAQRADGGWSVHFPIWTPITRFEWRGWQTVEMLKVLRMNGRLN